MTYCSFFSGHQLPRTCRSSAISPSSRGPFLVILGRFSPRLGPWACYSNWVRAHRSFGPTITINIINFTPSVLCIINHFYIFFGLVFKENVFFFFFRNKENVKSAMIFTPSSLQINVIIYAIDGFSFLKVWLVNHLIINECLKCVLVIGDTSICKIHVIKIAIFIKLLCI